MTDKAHPSDSRYPLLPCPYSGHTDSTDNACQEPGVRVERFRSPAGGDANRVVCCCGAQGPAKRGMPEAVSAWNRRALADPGGEGVPVAWNGLGEPPVGQGRVEITRPDPAFDVWDRLLADTSLRAMREKLSIHDLRLIIGHVRAADTHPEPVAWRPDRESVARIIDPKCYELTEALESADGEPEQLRRDATAMRDQRLAVALEKADAILALPSAPETGWRDIATAPTQHGCEVDLWLSSGERIADARGFLRNGVIVWHRLSDDGLHERIHTAPTHWMPLPDAPAAPSPKGGA